MGNFKRKLKSIEKIEHFRTEMKNIICELHFFLDGYSKERINEKKTDEWKISKVNHRGKKN